MEATVAVIVLLVEVWNSSIGRSSSSGSGSGSSSGRGTISSSSINTIRHSSGAHEHAAQHVPGTRYRTWDAIYFMTDTKSVCEASLFRVFWLCTGRFHHLGRRLHVILLKYDDVFSIGIYFFIYDEPISEIRVYREDKETRLGALCVCARWLCTGGYHYLGRRLHVLVLRCDDSFLHRHDPPQVQETHAS